MYTSSVDQKRPVVCARYKLTPEDIQNSCGSASAAPDGPTDPFHADWQRQHKMRSCECETGGTHVTFHSALVASTNQEANYPTRSLGHALTY